MPDTSPINRQSLTSTILNRYQSTPSSALRGAKNIGPGRGGDFLDGTARGTVSNRRDTHVVGFPNPHFTELGVKYAENTLRHSNVQYAPSGRR